VLSWKTASRTLTVSQHPDASCALQESDPIAARTRLEQVRQQARTGLEETRQAIQDLRAARGKSWGWLEQ
jgi:signal transduction histidine kinase